MKSLADLFVAVLLCLFVSTSFADAPTSFSAAKATAKREVFLDERAVSQGDLYCGCRWDWVGRSGGRVDASSCGYETRAQQTRAERIEWEHIVPAWVFGHQRQCWQNGGRRNCVMNDPVFRVMEADLFNLYPSVGEVNGDRSNFQYAMIGRAPAQYGACTSKVDFQQRMAEPRDDVKGLVARVHFYMYDRYGLSMSRQQQQLLMAWSRQYPVTEWEQEWSNRTARVMGHSNPFVTGDRVWSLGYRPTRDGVVSPGPVATPAQGASSAGGIIGNRNSKVYHLPSGCPSYDRVAPRNQVHFDTEAAAVAAGFRKAGNCSD